ncbi:DUF3408 domain-containing protein [Bacteroides uniformis]|uniref:DUF3408 domain-containing protein n=1 Tax=Bacteroides uniformis TaxID=820 RepID=UPI00232F3746|nr:DUF3408 domain-containing protein [Bacteroides uniformis]MDC1840190.1 DUF3408 domain-containing protein [Bacteroides uniformis]
MSKKFKNIENDEEFKNFKLEDYLPSMSRREQEEKPSDSEQTPVKEAANLFPVLDEPGTSVGQVVISAIPPHEETWEASDDEAKESATDVDVPGERRVVVRRVSSKQRRLSLDEYRTTYLQVPKITDRKPVFVSGEVRDSLDRIVRYFGGRGMSASGMVENLVRLHLETYREDIEQWRKL